MRRRRSYSNSGQHRLSMHQGSHALQRSVSGTLSRTSSYRTTSQRELIARASSDGPRSASWGGGDAEPQLRGSFSASLGGQRPSRRMARGTSQRDLMAGGGGGGAAGTSGRLIGGRYRVQEHRCIGGGGTSRVYEATDEDNGEPCAVKTMDGKHDRLQASVLAGLRSSRPSAGDVVFADRRLMEELKREVDISLRLDHPNIVALLDVVFETRPRVYEKVHLIQELATGGDLHSLVSQQGALPELRARHIFRQVASAVQYCHSNSVYHRVR